MIFRSHAKERKTILLISLIPKPLPIPSISVSSQTIQCKTRKLKTRWSLGMASDFMHNLGIEENLTIRLRNMINPSNPENIDFEHVYNTLINSFDSNKQKRSKIISELDRILEENNIYIESGETYDIFVGAGVIVEEEYERTDKELLEL